MIVARAHIVSIGAKENGNARQLCSRQSDPERNANVAGKHDDSVEFPGSDQVPDAGINQAKEFADRGTWRNIFELHPGIVVEQGNVPGDLNAEVAVDVRFCALQAAIRDEYFEVGALRHKAPHRRAVLRRMRAEQQYAKLVVSHFAGLTCCLVRRRPVEGRILCTAPILATDVQYRIV